MSCASLPLTPLTVAMEIFKARAKIIKIDNELQTLTEGKKLPNKPKSEAELLEEQSNAFVNDISSLQKFAGRLKEGIRQQQVVARPRETSGGNVAGVEKETSVQQVKMVERVIFILAPSLQITELQYKGEWAIGGIAPIYGNMVCVAHYEDFLWVYTREGGLKEKVSIPEIGEIFGVVAVDGKQGKLAILDAKGGPTIVHFVTFSADLKVQQHRKREVKLSAGRISMSGQRQLILNNTTEKMFAVLPADEDKPMHTVRVDIPDKEILLSFIVQTKAGYVVCDKHNEKVHFTDRGGRTVHTFADCEKPRCAAVTSSGHVLIVDTNRHEIRVFSEVGDYLGSLQDNNRLMKQPWFIHIDEANGLLYVDCGPRDARELRLYKFTAGDLPPLPITRSVTNN